MKHPYIYLLLFVATGLLSSCEINDEILERSNSSIYNKLEADRNHSGQVVSPTGPNHISGDEKYESNCKIAITQECVLADTYACRLKASGATTSFKSYASHNELTVKEALSYLTGNRAEAIGDADIIQGGLDNVPKYVYLLPCNGDKYGDIVIFSLPAKSSDGFDGTVGIAKSFFNNPNTEITFSATSYSFLYGLYVFPDESYRNDAFLALMLDNDGVKMDPLAEDVTIEIYNPDHKRGIIVTRAIDSSGKFSNKVTRKTSN